MLKIESFEFYILSFLSNEQTGRLKIKSKYVFELVNAFIYIYIHFVVSYGISETNITSYNFFLNE